MVLKSNHLDIFQNSECYSGRLLSSVLVEEVVEEEESSEEHGLHVGAGAWGEGEEEPGEEQEKG